MTDSLGDLIQRWRSDAGATYMTWFLWEERLKNFRSIRRGLETVVAQIESGTFGNVYKGSALETVVGSIAEQRQIFRGADHAFLWKPKLHIPDIYESPENQLAFGRFLNTCACCSTEERLIEAIKVLDERKIKGLGPAVANLLYFLHPTLAPPFNTAIVRGYNALTGARVKLGRWGDYLAMRQGILRLNTQHRDLLSNDLGAVAGLLFDVGIGRYAAPPPPGDSAGLAVWQADLQRVRAESEAQSRREKETVDGEHSHVRVQAWLRDLGRALGYDVWVASNDRGRVIGSGTLGDGCLADLPTSITQAPGAGLVRLIDVLWLERQGSSVAAAFEVEHSTSIYSGILRLLDLALSSTSTAAQGLFLVAPDGREDEVRKQLARAFLRPVAEMNVRYLSYGELERNKEAMARFGAGVKAIDAIAKKL
jgi:type II restriction enzyme